MAIQYIPAKRESQIVLGINFTTDTEAGQVWVTLRRLKKHGYVLNYNVMEGTALVTLHPAYINTIMDAFQSLHDRGYRGIFAEEV